MDFKVLVTDINAVTALFVSTIVVYMSSLDAMYGHIQQQFAAIENAEENDNTGGQLTPLVISNHHYKSTASPNVAFVIHLRGLIVLLPHLTFFTAFYLLHVGTIVVSVSYLLFVGTRLDSRYYSLEPANSCFSVCCDIVADDYITTPQGNWASCSHIT